MSRLNRSHAPGRIVRNPARLDHHAEPQPDLVVARRSHACATRDRLDLLRRLYRQVVIPPAVLRELAIGSGRPGAAALGSASDAGWISVQPLANHRAVLELGQLLDLGEAEAIALTVQLGARFLLIDEAAGRQIAHRRGVPVTGVAGVLLSAKASGAVAAVGPIIEELSNAGYRLSSRLVSRVLERAGE